MSLADSIAREGAATAPPHPSANHGRDTHVTMRKFITHFAWGPKMDSMTETRVYEAAKLARTELLARVERWKTDELARRFPTADSTGIR